MAKNSVRDYDATNANNTDIQSIDISEGCSPAGINNAIREIMADLKDVSTGAVALESPSADSLTVTGDLTVDTSTLKVDSTNNRVGIANASPSVELDVTGAAKVSGDLTVDTNTLYVDSTNNRVGVGTVSPETSIHAAKSNSGAMGAELTLDNPSTSAVSNATGINFLNDSGASASGVANARIRSVTNNASTGAADIQFHTWNGSAEAERMRIDSNGNLQLGYGGQSATAFAAPQGMTIGSLDNVALQYYLRKGNQVEAHIGFKSSTDTNFYVGTGGGPGTGGIGSYGVYQANLSTSWSAVSDETQKTIVGNIENASEKVSTLRTVMGYYNTDETETHKPFLIAQDVQAVLPEAVSVADVETGILGLSYTDVIPLLTAAIKEQRETITALEARITALETA